MILDEHFWVAVSIIIFIALVYKHLKKFLNTSLKARENAIHQKLSEAAALNKAAETLLQEHRLLHQVSEAEAKNILNSAITETAYLKENAEKDLAARIQEKSASMTDRIRYNEAKLLERLRLESLELAIRTTTAILQIHGSKEINSKLLDDSVVAINDKLTKDIAA